MRLHVTFLFCLFCTSLAFAQTPTPVGAFHFDGDFIESVSGQTADTSTLSYNRISDPKGNPNTAIQITGGSVLFEPANFAVIDSGDYSIAFWFRNDAGLWPRETVFTGPNFLFRYNGFFDQLEFRLNLGDTTVFATIVPADGAWQHVAISIDRNDSMRYYMNGVLRYQKDISAFSQVQVTSTNPRLSIGNFDVSLEEVLFFDKALSKDEVNVLYRDNLTSIEPAHLHGIRMYPNPASNTVFFDHPNTQHSPYRIMDMQGKLLVSGTLIEGKADISALQAGIYMVLLAQKTGPISLPLVVN